MDIKQGSLNFFLLTNVDFCQIFKKYIIWVGLDLNVQLKII